MLLSWFYLWLLQRPSQLSMKTRQNVKIKIFFTIWMPNYTVSRDCYQALIQQYWFLTFSNLIWGLHFVMLWSITVIGQLYSSTPDQVNSCYLNTDEKTWQVLFSSCTSSSCTSWCMEGGWAEIHHQYIPVCTYTDVMHISETQKFRHAAKYKILSTW